MVEAYRPARSLPVPGVALYGRPSRKIFTHPFSSFTSGLQWRFVVAVSLTSCCISSTTSFCSWLTYFSSSSMRWAEKSRRSGENGMVITVSTGFDTECRVRPNDYHAGAVKSSGFSRASGLTAASAARAVIAASQTRGRTDGGFTLNSLQVLPKPGFTISSQAACHAYRQWARLVSE